MQGLNWTPKYSFVHCLWLAVTTNFHSFVMCVCNEERIELNFCAQCIIQTRALTEQYRTVEYCGSTNQFVCIERKHTAANTLIHFHHFGLGHIRSTIWERHLWFDGRHNRLNIGGSLVLIGERGRAVKELPRQIKWMKFPSVNWVTQWDIIKSPISFHRLRSYDGYMAEFNDESDLFTSLIKFPTEHWNRL